VGTAAWLDWIALKDGQSKEAKDKNAEIHDFVRQCKLLSVPLVSLLFTWFHVWLALQMMFYPIGFWGIPRGRAIVPQWLGLPVNGWQGIVPRKAGIMAKRCCEKMIGNICTVDEFMDRVKPEEFWTELNHVFGTMCSEVLRRIIQSRWPTIWSSLPAVVRAELEIKVYEEAQQSFLAAIEELKKNINTIIDIKEMATEALANDPATMVEMFRKIAARELVFITHVAAVMGFFLGLVQVLCYLALEGKWPYTDYILLPVSGLIIGYFTNWLALKMSFHPIMPHMFCSNTFNIQGVFLKRQAEASDLMAELICEKVIDARAMFKYIIQSPSSNGIDKVLEIYERNIKNTVDNSWNKVSNMAPSFVSVEVDRMKKDVVDITLEILPQHTQDIEKYLDKTMEIKKTLSWRLSHITPAEFEDIIHPIFQEDEWILLFVGGVLGVVIGLLQAFALINIK
jgi:uncharacterized membrane protein YheB (UPF0754 family)